MIRNIFKLFTNRHQHIDSAIPGRYTVSAPYKAGAGGRSPELHTAIYDAPASFLSSALTHARIMVGWAGEPKGSPVSVCAGTANPVQFTTHEFRSSGGGSYPLHTEAAIMATVPTPALPKIFTFLIQRPRVCRLAELRRIRTIAIIANTEAQARANLPGLSLVFMSRTPSKGVAA